MKLRYLNFSLLIAIVLINGYVLVLPVWPVIEFWWQERYGQKLNEIEAQAVSPKASANSTNKILIPAIMLDEPVTASNNESALAKGLWLKEFTSTPDRGGNTVVVGHRFTYQNPRGILYFLNKLKSNDQIVVIWQGKKYVYSVVQTKTVPANDLSVESSTERPALTLYTCTPLWNPKDRLVVTSRLEAVE